jgi:putative ABC transport system substrate-binding protein
MRRRDLLIGSAAILAATSACRPATAADKIPVIGYLALASRQSDASDRKAFGEGLRELGYAEGQTIKVAEIYTEGDTVAAEKFVRDLEQEASAFLVPGPAAARIVRHVTRTVPVVAIGLHPSGGQTDLFASLARPGGSVTGLSNYGEQLAAKRVELLKEVMPRLTTVAVFHNATDPLFSKWGAETEAEIRRQGLTAVRTGLTSDSGAAIAATMKGLREQGVEAVIVVRDFLTTALRDSIVRSARELRIAVIAEERRFADVGALMSYGASSSDLFRRAAGYIDRLLKGAKAADLPIELPTKFELVINRRTAAEIGVDIPPSILLRADEVIE